MIGLNRRLDRLLVGPERRCVLIPLDHGPWLGPVAGIDRPRDIVRKIVAGGATSLLMTPGFLSRVADLYGPGVGTILRVSLSAGLADEATQEIPAATAKTAVRLDADAVAVSVFFGRGGEVNIIRYLGQLIEECKGLEIPVLAEMMPPFDRFYDPERIAHAARIGMELGADIIKTNYCGDVNSFRDIVAATAVPVIVAGGPGADASESTLAVAEDAVKAGAAGVAFGRRVWQAADPAAVVRGLKEVVFSTRRLVG